MSNENVVKDKLHMFFIYSEETADMVDECRKLGGGKGARGSTDGGTEKMTSVSMFSTTRSIAALNRWRIAGGKGKDQSDKRQGAVPRLSCDSQDADTHNEITYVPTSALNAAMAEDHKSGNGKRTVEEDKTNAEYDAEEKVMKISTTILS